MCVVSDSVLRVDKDERAPSAANEVVLAKDARRPEGPTPAALSFVLTAIGRILTQERQVVFFLCPKSWWTAWLPSPPCVRVFFIDGPVRGQVVHCPMGNGTVF
jgi:hypothetical protein